MRFFHHTPFATADQNGYRSHDRGNSLAHTPHAFDGRGYPVYFSAKDAYIYSMIAERDIRQVAERLGQAANADQVILFGSHARGVATEHSDVDLLVVADSDLPRFKRSRSLYSLLRPYPFSMDLVVYTPEEVEKGRQAPLSFVATVLREGKTVYVRPH